MPKTGFEHLTQRQRSLPWKHLGKKNPRELLGKWMFPGKKKSLGIVKHLGKKNPRELLGKWMFPGKKKSLGIVGKMDVPMGKCCLPWECLEQHGNCWETVGSRGKNLSRGNFWEIVGSSGKKISRGNDWENIGSSRKNLAHGNVWDIMGIIGKIIIHKEKISPMGKILLNPLPWECFFPWEK
jgi:hypothetical protein